MSTPDGEEREVAECPDCGAEYEIASYCAECGFGREVGELVESEPALPEPVVARSITAGVFPVHEPAWCPHCLVWLGTFPSTEEARGVETALADHPFEYCVPRKAKLSGSEEWRLRNKAAKFGSLARAPPTAARVPERSVSA